METLRLSSLIVPVVQSPGGTVEASFHFCVDVKCIAWKKNSAVLVSAGHTQLSINTLALDTITGWCANTRVLLNTDILLSVYELVSFLCAGMTHLPFNYLFLYTINCCKIGQYVFLPRPRPRRSAIDPLFAFHVSQMMTNWQLANEAVTATDSGGGFSVLKRENKKKEKATWALAKRLGFYRTFPYWPCLLFTPRSLFSSRCSVRPHWSGAIDERHRLWPEYWSHYRWLGCHE